MSGAKKKRVPKVDVLAFRNPKPGVVNTFSDKGVKKPVRATYYGKKAR